MNGMSNLGLGYLEFQGYKDYFEKLKKGTENVRAIAAFALGQIGDETTVSEIINTLEQDESSTVKMECIRALTMIRDPKAIPSLIKMLKDDNASVRSAAAIALGTLKASEALNSLLQALHDINTEVRINAIDSISEIGNTQVLKSMYTALQDPEALVRRHAAGALGILGNKDSVPYLIKMLDDQDAITKMMAAWSLGEIGESALDSLIKILKESSGENRIFALEAITLIPKPTKALDVVKGLANSTEEWIKNVAKQTLDKIQ